MVLTLQYLLFITLLLTLAGVYSSSISPIGLAIHGETADDLSGHSVSLSADGKVIAIGAPYNGGNGEYAGHVRVYANVEGQWLQVGQDMNGKSAQDRLGFAVSLSADGSTVAIGAPYHGDYVGHVRVFHHLHGAWQQRGQDIDGEASGDLSGRSLSLSADGTHVAIGSPRHAGLNGTNSGHVRVFQYKRDRWLQLGQTLAGEAPEDQSGFAVSLSVQGVVPIVAIGTPFNTANGRNSGHVRVYGYFPWPLDRWMQLGQDIDGAAAGDWSGYSVSLSADGSVLAIGSPYNDGMDGLLRNVGQVRVFKYLFGVKWVQLGAAIDGEGVADMSGLSVSLAADGTSIAIGSPYNNDNGRSAGQVRLYQYAVMGRKWTQLATDIEGESADDTSGRSVSLSVDDGSWVVAIGAPYNNANGLRDAGQVRVLRIL